MASTGPQQSRFQEALGSVPLVTLIAFLICCIVFIIQNTVFEHFYSSTSLLALTPLRIVYLWEWYRVVTAAFTHGGILHIGMNMLTLMSFGPALEPLFGSLRFFFMMILYTLLIGLFYVASAFMYAAISVAIWGPTIPGMAEPVLFSGAVGFSGVLFAMAVDESALNPAPTRSVFGLFNVPTKLYPWVLMAVLQFIIPGVSFLGHLMGAIVGVLHSAGVLEWALPSMVTLRKLESMPWFAPIKRSRPYKLTPQQEVLFDSENSLRAVFGRLLSAMACVVRPVTDCCRSMLGRAGSTVSSATGAGAGAAARRVVDDSGRLGAAAVDVPGQAPPASSSSWLAPGALVTGASSSGSGGYVRVESEEGTEQGPEKAVHEGGQVEQPVASDPAKVAAREKAARAAEARLAAAAAANRPSVQAPPGSSPQASPVGP